MLRSQYGIAASSSVTPTALHAEDAQPNEAIYKRRHGHPPQIGSTWNNNYRDSGIQRGGYSGPWTQYGMRGNGNISRRGRGNFQPNRGGHHNSNPNQRHNRPGAPVYSSLCATYSNITRRRRISHTNDTIILYLVIISNKTHPPA